MKFAMTCRPSIAFEISGDVKDRFWPKRTPDFGSERSPLRPVYLSWVPGAMMISGDWGGATFSDIEFVDFDKAIAKLSSKKLDVVAMLKMTDPAQQNNGDFFHADLNSVADEILEDAIRQALKWRPGSEFEPTVFLRQFAGLKKGHAPVSSVKLADIGTEDITGTPTAFGPLWPLRSDLDRAIVRSLMISAVREGHPKSSLCHQWLVENDDGTPFAYFPDLRSRIKDDIVVLSDEVEFSSVGQLDRWLREKGCTALTDWNEMASHIVPKPKMTRMLSTLLQAAEHIAEEANAAGLTPTEWWESIAGLRSAPAMSV